jgi:HD-GYP domain-containing protein (c-di-GMP phosphodiesterase class II)
MLDREDMPGDEPTGEDDTLRIRTLGGIVISRLNGLLRGMRFYGAGNRALLAQQQDLLDAVKAIQADEVSLLGMGEYFYVNGVRLRPEGSSLPVFRTLLAEFEARRLGGLRFSAQLGLEELESFLRVLLRERHEKAAAALRAATTRTGVANICAIQPREMGAQMPTEGERPGDDDRHEARAVFSRAVRGTRALLQRTRRTGRPALQQARRVVQPIVDRLLRDEDSLVGLTALKRHDEYTFAHCVNVSILSVRMGQLLGLSRPELAGIGVAALLHDTGKIMVPADVLRKPGQLDPEEWAAIRRHPVEGLRIISRMTGLSELMLSAMRVAFEHHMNVNQTGYPGVRGGRAMSPFSRIVAVADVFDAMTAHRAYRKRPLTAHEALRLMLGRECEQFDRAVLWALVNTVGLYPAGTLMRMESGRVLLSLSPNVADPRRPLCRALTTTPREEAAPIAPDFVLDAHERVMRVLAPEDVDVDVEDQLAA